jgi:hypothetical protein
LPITSLRHRRVTNETADSRYVITWQTVTVAHVRCLCVLAHTNQVVGAISFKMANLNLAGSSRNRCLGQREHK